MADEPNGNRGTGKGNYDGRTRKNTDEKGKFNQGTAAAPPCRGGCVVTIFSTYCKAPASARGPTVAIDAGAARSYLGPSL